MRASATIWRVPQHGLVVGVHPREDDVGVTQRAVEKVARVRVVAVGQTDVVDQLDEHASADPDRAAAAERAKGP